MRPIRFCHAALAVVLLVAAGCARDEPADTADDPVTEGDYTIEEGAPEVRVTPAESIAAARGVRARSDSVRRAARASAGLPPDDTPPPPKPAVAPRADDAYASCMAQAQVADGVVRARIEAACERQRGAGTDGS